jgi:hypothetical protein
MWKRFSLLVEGNAAGVFPPKDPFISLGIGGIIEFYPFVFDEGKTKVGIGLGGGYGIFYDNTWYFRAEIPFIFPWGKLGLRGEYYPFDDRPAFRVGLMYFVRGEQVLDFLQDQTLFQ